MGKESSHPLRPPEVDATETLKRRRFEAELFSLDGQVRGFGRIRDRLTAGGRDAPAFYRQLQARRQKVLAALGRLGFGEIPSEATHGAPHTGLDEPLLAHPISPARFNDVLGTFGIGTSGVVQMAPATEGIQDVVAGPYPHSGAIVTVPGSYPGEVTFKGVLNVGPESADQYDPTIDYFWIHNWNYLIPFPAPTVDSRFTYRFSVHAVIDVVFGGGEGNVMCFFSIGETPNLTTGTSVVVGPEGGGFPLIADLTQPGPGYNGHYGVIQGNAITVQRSFMVAAGHIPGVAIVVGAIGALSMMSEVALTFFSGWSGINVGSQNRIGRVEYSYEPEMVVSPG